MLAKALELLSRAERSDLLGKDTKLEIASSRQARLVMTKTDFSGNLPSGHSMKVHSTGSQPFSQIPTLAETTRPGVQQAPQATARKTEAPARPDRDENDLHGTQPVAYLSPEEQAFISDLFATPQDGAPPVYDQRRRLREVCILGRQLDIEI